MRYKIKMMTGDELFISEETAINISKINNQSGLTRISELRGFINLSSVSSILPEDVSEEAERNNPKALKEFVCHDGMIAVYNAYKNIWHPKGNPDTKIDLDYYSELRKPTEPKKDYPQLNNPENIKRLSENFSM
jgi:hypothetical protein